MDNYPPGAANDPNAPYNEQIIPDMEFDVTVSISLSKTVVCNTNDYGIEYDDATHHIELDTSDTNWSSVYTDNHYTIPQLLEMLKQYVQKDLDKVHEVSKEHNINEKFLKRKYEHILSECDNWTIDEEVYEGE